MGCSRIPKVRVSDTLIVARLCGSSSTFVFGKKGAAELGSLNFSQAFSAPDMPTLSCMAIFFSGANAWAANEEGAFCLDQIHEQTVTVQVFSCMAAAFCRPIFAISSPCSSSPRLPSPLGSSPSFHSSRPTSSPASSSPAPPRRVASSAFPEEQRAQHAFNGHADDAPTRGWRRLPLF